MRRMASFPGVVFLLCVSLGGVLPVAAVTALSPDGRYQAVSIPEPGVVIIHDLRYESLGRDTVLRLSALNEPVQSLAFSPDGQQLAARGSQGQWRVWNVLPGGALEPAESPR